MESTNRITDDAMESAKYGLQMTQSKNGRLKANRPPAQVTLYHLKWARSALRDLWHSVWGSRCVIDPHTSSYKSHKALLAHFK